jgi:hypothetical protein
VKNYWARRSQKRSFTLHKESSGITTHDRDDNCRCDREQNPGPVPGGIRPLRSLVKALCTHGASERKTGSISGTAAAGSKLDRVGDGFEPGHTPRPRGRSRGAHAVEFSKTVAPLLEGSSLLSARRGRDSTPSGQLSIARGLPSWEGPPVTTSSSSSARMVAESAIGGPPRECHLRTFPRVGWWRTRASIGRPRAGRCARPAAQDRPAAGRRRRTGQRPGGGAGPASNRAAAQDQPATGRQLGGLVVGRRRGGRPTTDSLPPPPGSA